MPLSVADEIFGLLCELFLRVVVEFCFHFTGRGILFMVTGGKMQVADDGTIGERGRVRRMDHLSERRDRQVYVHFDMATLVGALFWLTMIGVIALVVWLV